MQQLSVIITTYNEIDNIRPVLENIQWADEIIVVDSFSTDGTADAAKAMGATVYERAYSGPADQKNWAIQQVSHDWILLLDADERITPELQAEIQGYLQQPNIDMDAFWIGRLNHFMGKKIRYSGWQGDAVVRFFNKKCRYNDKQVHEEIETNGIRVSKLQHKMLHYTFKDIDHFLDKMRRYAKWSAQDHSKKDKKVSYFHLWGKPLFRFVKHFFIQKGFLDGKEGFIVSSIMAWGVFLRYVYMKGEE